MLHRTNTPPRVPSPTVPVPPTPPPEVKEVIDKLIIWVVKNGIKFEQKVKEKESKNEKFGFLYPWNPHNAYYKYALEKVPHSFHS